MWLGGSWSLPQNTSKIACTVHRPLAPQLASNPEKVQNEGVTVEVQWSELQRDPKGVAALADRGDVRVRRRDGAALLLTREDRVSSTAEGAVAAARALRNLLAHMEPQVAATALVDEFPWADLLPQRDRAQFVADFVRAFQASAEMGQWTPLAQTVRGWKATAAVYADPELVEQLSNPLNDDFGPVPDPTEN
jgi:hypothetical protein